MKLVIVESPNKTKKIAHYLGGGFEVLATAGHFRDLPDKELGVDKVTFEPSYVVDEEKKGLVSKLKAAAKNAEQVFLATDADREGEAISWHLQEELHLRNAKRMRFTEITEKALKEALRLAGPLDQHLVDAQQARRVVDRLVGYEVSPLLQALGPKHSAGRVQSATLHLVAEREKAIEAFAKKPFWTLTSRYANALTAKYVTPKEGAQPGDELQDVRFASQEEADAIAAKARGPHSLHNVATQPVERKPKAPFTTSTLQQAASVSLGFKPDVTMQLAQKLFESGLISYHRSDSVSLSDDAVKMARDFLQADYPEALPPAAPTYTAKASAQGAHEAIRPTSLGPEPLEELKGQGDALELYQLIRKRFLASQCKPAVFDQTTITLVSGETTWRARGSVLRFPSFLKYLDEDEDSESKKDEPAEPRLPKLELGQLLELASIDVKRQETKPPPRFTQATLIREMEKVGIGRPSTYASTIAVLFARTYIAEEKKYVLPTPRGRTIDSVLERAFGDLVKAAYTADMETRLDDVAEGKRKWKDEIRVWYAGFDRLLQAAPALINAELKARPELAAEAPQAPKLTDKTCPKCGQLLRQHEGKKGPYLACSGYPRCDFSGQLDAKASEHLCPKCSKPTVEQTGQYGRYAKCLDKECGGIKDLAFKPSDKTCIKCQAPVVEKESKNGPYLRCTASACGIAFPLDAVLSEHKCPTCDKPMLETTGKFGRYAKCLTKDCTGTADLAPTVETKCPKCGAPMKSKGDFLGCSTYPTCKATLDVKALAKAEKAGKRCPKCSRLVMEKKGPKGKFWGCSGYPECKYIEERPGKS